MTLTWLTLTAALASMALIAVWARRPSSWRLASVLTLPLAAFVAFIALQVPLGKPTDDVPPGKYAVLGARIDVDVAIYVLIDGPEPVYIRLPYSKEAAEALQEAMNGEGGIEGEMTAEGEMRFHERPVTAGEPKRAESPEFEVM